MGLELRSNNWQEMKVTAGADVVAGEMDLLGSVVGVYVEAEDSGDDVTFIYQCDKIVVPKVTGTGKALTQGAKVYFDATENKVTPTSGGNTLCGRCLVAAGASDTTVEIVLNGAVAA